jgi:hypothetical protein
MCSIFNQDPEGLMLPALAHKTGGAAGRGRAAAVRAARRMPLSTLPPDVLALIMKRLDAVELTRLCCVGTAVCAAERMFRPDLWRTLTTRKWASASQSAAARLLAWKAHYKFLLLRDQSAAVLSRAVISIVPSIAEINARFDFMLECTSPCMKEISTGAMRLCSFNLPPRVSALSGEQRVCFVLDGGPFAVVGRKFELFARRRADGAVASFAVMRRGAASVGAVAHGTRGASKQIDDFDVCDSQLYVYPELSASWTYADSDLT